MKRIYQIRFTDRVVFRLSASKHKVKKWMKERYTKKQLKEVSWIACVK